MDHLIDWCGFLGAWLLVIGPLNQGARELSEEESKREEFEEAAQEVVREDSPSAWWWLLPPVFYWKHHQVSKRYEAAVLDVLSPEQIRDFNNIRDKASAWLAVSLGALLIAVKETWELVEGYDWPETYFWVLIVAMSVIAVGNTMVGLRRRAALSTNR